MSRNHRAADCDLCHDDLDTLEAHVPTDDEAAALELLTGTPIRRGAYHRASVRQWATVGRVVEALRDARAS